jgi:hypothetical protein
MVKQWPKWKVTMAQGGCECAIAINTVRSLNNNGNGANRLKQI